MPHRSGFQLGPWLLTSKIAAGGMGEVFVGLRAGRGNTQVPVAVKALLPHLSSDVDAVRRFLSEASVAAHFHHPNLVRILDVGEHEGRYWLAMELVRGVSLATLLAAAKKRGTTIPPEVLVWVGHALCDGLAHAHAQHGTDGAPLELVHRDVTPHNVLAGVDGQVKLTDFGVAQVRDSDANSRGGPVHGKLQFMSPEQLERQPTDRRSDLYAAGVTLFCLASLDEPFPRASPLLTARAIRSEEPPSLASLRPDLPPAFVAAVDKAMARKPQDRFASASELRDALGPVAPDAREKLGSLVRVLCSEEVDALTAAVMMAEALAPQTAAMAPIPSLSPPSMPRPRGTVEVRPPRLEKPARWPWVLGVVAALGLAAALLARWV